jgi:hypothetical protein
MALDDVHIQEDLSSGAPISLSHLMQVFKRYAGVILISLAAVGIAYLIISATILLLAPRQGMTSMPFRLEFVGADSGSYPNGLKFSVADITATPVLLHVFNSNELGRFATFDEFAASLFVLESNSVLDQLSMEYQAKLADPKLSSVDRQRLEQEFKTKSASLSKSDYTVQFTKTEATKDIPIVLIPKILDDTLRTWARRAAIEKKVLDYRVSPLTANILSDVRVENGQYLVPLLLLRRRVDDVMQNVSKMFQMPGSELIRTQKERKSLEEIQLTLDELVRFRLEPMIATARAGGLLGSSSDALRVLRAQLSYDERALAAARGREAALRSALATYESNQAPAPGVPTTTPTMGPEGSNRETVMPQLSDTFLDRIVELADRSADRNYRQRLTDEIKQASLSVVPLQAAVQYDRELIASFSNPPGGNQAGVDLEGPWKSILADVHEAIQQVNEIHISGSRQLYPESELYRSLGPPVTRTHRVVSTARIALGGVLAFLIAIPLIIGIVLIHNRIREENQSFAEKS